LPPKRSLLRAAFEWALENAPMRGSQIHKYVAETVPNGPQSATQISPGFGRSMPASVPLEIICPALNPIPLRDSSLASQ
jgi:hypothetical protein